MKKALGGRFEEIIEDAREMMQFGAVHAGSDPAFDRRRPSITWAFPDHKVNLYLL